jgi:hypothetical protein
MSARSLLQALVISTATIGFVPVLYAQDASPAAPATPEVDTAKYQVEGEINANAVYIRSGASENDYACMKLDKGSHVTVVGIKFEWLKIVPPDGSFCYVAKAFVDRRNDGGIGRTNAELRVRVGSQLNDLKNKVAMSLPANSDVTIIGDKDEYFKIKPPAGVFMYVNKQFVDLVKVAGPTDGAGGAPNANNGAASGDQTAGAPTTAPTGTQVANLGTPVTAAPAGTENTGATPTTNPAEAVAGNAPTTQPMVDPITEATVAFDKLENDLTTANTKSLEEQPTAELLEGYKKVAANTALPESMRRIAEFRIASLKVRNDDREKYVALKKSQEVSRQKQMALQAERTEIEDKIKQNGVTYYAAVGTLRVSSIQQGNGTLYRLTDPGTGRTLVYLRSNDPKLGALTGQFIGVKGDVASDTAQSLKVISPSEFEAVDQAKVGGQVAAQIIPPSLASNTSQAKTE